MRHDVMGDKKSVPMTFRVTPRFKRLLAKAAKLNMRSSASMLEWLVSEHCNRNAIVDDSAAMPVEVGEPSDTSAPRERR